MKTYRIHLIRHGLTDANRQGLYIGCRTDVPLCEQGIAELMKIKKNYDYPKVQMVYTSPLKRCTQTANILYPDRFTVPAGDLAECDFGEFEGRAASEVSSDPRMQRWFSGENCEDLDIEKPVDFAARCIRGYRQILADMMDRKITDAAVITHGGVIMTILYAIAVPKKEMFEWISNNGMGYTTLVNPLTWMHDGVIEVTGLVPYLSADDPDYGKIYETDGLDRFMPKTQD